MEKITIGAFLLGAIIWWKRIVFFVKKAWEIWVFWSPVIDQIVEQVEKDAQDGKITAAERKATALKSIDLISGKIGKPLNSVQKWVISWLIDKAAGKLIPHDIIIPDITEKARNVKA